MESVTAELWAGQDRHEGDRRRLCRAVSDAVDVQTVLYPGSYVDIAPSFVWPDVTYVDVDRRAARVFDDEAGVREIIAAEPDAPEAELDADAIERRGREIPYSKSAFAYLFRRTR